MQLGMQQPALTVVVDLEERGRNLAACPAIERADQAFIDDPNGLVRDFCPLGDVILTDGLAGLADVGLDASKQHADQLMTIGAKSGGFNGESTVGIGKAGRGSEHGVTVGEG